MRKEMRICLSPWDGYKSSGPYLHAKNGRYHINLLTFNSTSRHLNLTYAKYLAAIKYGRIPESGEEVDHIDGDRTNDTLSNLRIVSREENQEKAKSEEGYQPRKGVFLYTCSFCSKTYLISKSNAPHLKGNKRAFCSRECSHLGKDCPEGLNFVAIHTGVNKTHVNKQEKWESFSKEVLEEDVLVSSSFLVDKAKYTDKIVKAIGRSKRPCAVCNRVYTPTSIRQRCCSRECSNRALALSKGFTPTTKEDLEKSLLRILHRESSWVQESKVYKITDNALRNRMRRVGLSW